MGYSTACIPQRMFTLVWELPLAGTSVKSALTLEAVIQALMAAIGLKADKFTILHGALNWRWILRGNDRFLCLWLIFIRQNLQAEPFIFIVNKYYSNQS